MKKIDSIQIAVDSLKQGKIVVFPTETSYGLGCDATNQKAVDKIFKIKKRPRSKPLLVVASSVAMAKKYLRWNKTLDKLAKKYWPGPLTIIGESRAALAKGVVAPDNTVALRVTSHPIARRLCAKLGRPIVATSANISDAGDAYDSRELVKIFAGKKHAPDFLIDAGYLPRRAPSTIVSVTGEKIKIIRQGRACLPFLN